MTSCPLSSNPAKGCSLSEALSIVRFQENASGDQIVLETPGSTQAYAGVATISW